MSPNQANARKSISPAQALRWWAEAGVDLAIDEAPHDRFDKPDGRMSALAPAEDSPPAVGAARRIEPSAIAPPDQALRSARATAASAASLADLRKALEGFDGCGLKATATQLVFSDGAADAEIMLIGEAPGAEEDRIGRPFVGRAGQLLDRMLAAIGLDRSKVYIANVVAWRPPGNRTPTLQETAICMPFIQRQIELVSPRIIVCLGASSAQTLLGVKEGITRARGKWFEYPLGDGAIPALAMLHPAFLLRQPAQKRAAWRDWRALARALESLPDKVHPGRE
jgi:uracil-DNA glycosylase